MRITKSKEETWQFASELLENLEGRNVIALEGELGAGKTTFAQGILQAAGAEGPFTSPTFVIMKVYPLDNFQFSAEGGSALDGQISNFKFNRIYHLDCYRVGSNDVADLGWEEIISNPRNLVLVEWPERIREILPDNIVSLRFNIINERERNIEIIDPLRS